MIFQNISKTLDSLCQPDVRIMPDIVQSNTTKIRNKMVFYFLTLSTIMMIFTAPTSQNPSRFVHAIIFNIFFLVLFLITCRKRRTLFSTMFFVCNSALGPYFYLVGGTSSFIVCWVDIFYSPTINYFVTNSKKILLTSVSFQLYLLKYHYIKIAQSFIEANTPNISASAFSRIIFISIILIFLFFAVLNGHMNRTAENSFREELKRKELESEQLFSMGFTHEVRNFINGLSGNLQLAISLCNPEDKILDYLNNSNFCSGMLLQLMNNVLDTGKAQFGQLEIVPTNENIFITFKNLWSTASQMIKRKQLSGIISLSKDLPRYLKVDHYRITQVLLNLVTNAVKFTDQGVIQIKIEYFSKLTQVTENLFPENLEDDEATPFKNLNFSFLEDNYKFLLDEKIDLKKISSVDSCPNGILRISVSDTGIGITSEGMNKLFKQFSQVSEGERKKQGTGLGLYITRLLCRKMDGDIKVYSKRGIGSVFTICIPINQQLSNKHI